MRRSISLYVLLIVAILLCVHSLAFAQATQAKQQPSQQQFRPKMISVDRNSDGKPDRFEHYDAQGVIQKVELDTDGDGKVDEWIFYEKGVAVRGEKDVNKDGKPESKLFYDEKGILVRTETDSTGDGKIDEWVYYTSGVPVKAEKDTNADGKVDTWLNY